MAIIKENKVDIIKKLLDPKKHLSKSMIEHLFRSGKNKITPLSCAIKENNIEIVKLILDFSKDIDFPKDKCTDILELIFSSNSKNISVLSQAKIEKNKNKNKNTKYINYLKKIKDTKNTKCQLILKAIIDFASNISRKNVTTPPPRQLNWKSS